MAENMADISISLRAKQVADRFVEEGYFSTRAEAAIFAAAYILKTQFNSFDPSTYVVSDGAGLNNAYGTYDRDGKWEKLLSSLYKTDTPRTYLRNLMVYGLETLGDEIESTGRIQIADFI